MYLILFSFLICLHVLLRREAHFHCLTRIFLYALVAFWSSEDCIVMNVHAETRAL